MIKNYFSIILLLLFFSFQGVSGNSIERNLLNVVFSEFKAPPCETIGNSCDDGNPNTTNDVVSADCVCRGIAVAPAASCADAQLTYELNGGPRRPGVPALSVSEGDDITLFSNLQNYTVTGPNGLVAGNAINAITPAQAGDYTVNETFRLADPTAAPIILSASSSDARNPIENAFNGNPSDFWHTQYADPFPTGTPGPHNIELDMGAGSFLSGFTYLPRQDTNINGLVGQYRIYVSNSRTAWGSPVASGTWSYPNRAVKTVNFTAIQGRYLRFEMITEVNGYPFASAAEIGVIRVRPTATASSQETAAANLASYAVDGNNATFWHTRYTGGLALGPHHLTLDLIHDSNVSGLEYLPRQSGVNGTITGYQIFVSNSNTNWGTAVATGTWPSNASLKTVSFTEKRGRYVRLVATSATGGSLASAAEVRTIRTINMPCSKTMTINVDPIIVYTYDGTWSPEDPRNIVTANDTIKIASGNLAVSSDLTHYNLIIQPGASLTVNAGVTLTTNTLTLESESNMYSSLIGDGTITGDINYKRYTNIRGTALGGGNDLISAPLAGQMFGSFATTNAANLSASGTKRALAPYNTAAGEYQNYDTTTNASTVLASGVGFRGATDDGSQLIFTGTVPNTDVDVSLSGDALGGAWNLIGNPYPSYMRIPEFFSLANSEQLNSSYVAIYGYTGNKNSWAVYNNLTGAGVLMAPGQGFFVKAKSTGGDIKFTPSMRSIGEGDDFIAGRPQNTNKLLSKLKLNDGTKEAVTSVYFVDGSTKALDPGFDAAAYGASKVDFSLYTNLLEDNTGLDIAIQALPYNDFNNVIVPLGMKVKANVELNISIDDLSSLPSNINVYLEDTQTKTLTLLNRNVFKFTPKTALNGAGRFNVHYSAKTLSVRDMQSNDNLRIYTTISPKSLYIVGQLTKSTTAYLYDLQGRLVLSKVLNANNTENTIDISTLSTGVYVVKVNNDNQVKTQKVLIK